MSDAYLQWCLESGDDGLDYRYAPPADTVVQERRKVLVVDAFSTPFAILSPVGLF